MKGHFFFPKGDEGRSKKDIVHFKTLLATVSIVLTLKLAIVRVDLCCLLYR